MFATYLFVDDIKAPRERRAVRCPSAESVESAIRRLDGKFVRNVIVAEKAPSPGDDYPFGGRAVSIGGCENRYVIELCDDRGNVKYWLREGASLGQGTSTIMRGQLVDFDDAVIVPFEDVLRVVTAFYDNGSILEPQRWIE